MRSSWASSRNSVADSHELDVLIVGSGPSGAATGIALSQLAPHIAERTLCIDKATHPRPKTCGGGLTRHTIDQLDRLGVDLAPVPSVRIDRCVAAYGDIRHTLALERTFEVVRRADLDAQIARQLTASGVRLSEGEAYVRHERDGDHRLRVVTTRTEYRVKALVAADGAGSKIARSIAKARRPSVHLAQLDVPMHDGIDPHAMVYDFTSVTRDLYGYTWVFPTPLQDHEGRPLANVGLMQVGSTRLGNGMPALLERELARWGLTTAGRRLNFHPEWAFDPAYPFSAPNILTVGDAAGIDPLFGEGLSQCLEYGFLAARLLVDALPEGRTDFGDYRRRVLTSRFGREMWLLSIPATRFYRPGNAVWASFVFKDGYLPGLMAAQGQGKLWLQDRVLPIGLRAAAHVLRGG